MQTFLISEDPKETAKILDNKRLGKQRIEAITIANILLGVQKSNAWKNHPAVKMWRGYEVFLVKEYLRSMMIEWNNRGFHNTLCMKHYFRLSTILEDRFNFWGGFGKIKKPHWLCDRLFISHKSNLIRKDRNHYEKFWPGVPSDIEYYWPTKEDK